MIATTSAAQWMELRVRELLSFDYHYLCRLVDGAVLLWLDSDSFVPCTGNSSCYITFFCHATGHAHGGARIGLLMSICTQRM